MTLNEVKECCLSKPGTRPDFPFDEETLVLKVGSKMFALVNINRKPVKVNLKCDPFCPRICGSSMKKLNRGTI